MANKDNIKKIVLAYSGGLDTSIIIPWLKENYNNPEIIAVAGNVGQADELEGLEEKAIATGASKLIVADLVDEMVDDIIIPSLKMGAKYETYLLGTAFARPVIGKKLAEIALAEGADAIAHGATGKGNDQVRFELTIKALSPETKIIAPWRIWDIKSREDAVDFANAHNIPVPVTKKRPYSMDRNVLHLSHEGADLEDPANEPLDDLYLICNRPEDAPDEAEYITLTFEKGNAVKLNGEALTPLAMLEKLNALGAKHGIGILDIVENRLVGMKSRGVYETPGGTILHVAHQGLESLTLDRSTMEFKAHAAVKYAQLVYDGLWYTPLKEALDAFIDKTQETCSGDVRLKLYKGSCTTAGMTSPYSLYNEEFVTFGEDEVYNQADAEGFINLFGLPLKVNALMKRNLQK